MELMAEVSLFNPNVPVPYLLLEPLQIMWSDKYLHTWEIRDVGEFCETVTEGQTPNHCVTLVDLFIRKAKEVDCSETALDNLYSQVMRTSYLDDWRVNNVMTALKKHLKRQREWMEKPQKDPRTVDEKLEVIARRVIDEAVLTRNSKDNVSLTIVLLRNKKHSPSMVIPKRETLTVVREQKPSTVQTPSPMPTVAP